MRLSALVFTLGLGVATGALAGPAEEAWNAFLSGDFNRVAQIVSATERDTSLTAGERARLYFALGCGEAMRGREAPARGAFRLALSLDATLSYAEAELPPPVWKLYSPLQEAVSRLSGDLLLPASPTRQSVSPLADGSDKPTARDTVRITLPVMHSRWAVAQSLLCPGWGHLSEGNRRGYWFAGAEALLVLGWGAAARASRDAEDDYLKARSAADLSRTYERYNDRHRLAWGLGLAAAGVYLVAQWDFFTMSPPSSVVSGSAPRGAAISCQWSIGAWGVSVRIGL